MNTVCKIADIDIYLLYFLKIKTIFVLSTITKDENELISKQDFFREMQILRKGNIVNKFNIIDIASQYGYISILKWMDKSVCKFKYSTYAIYHAARNGARRRSRSYPPPP